MTSALWLTYHARPTLALIAADVLAEHAAHRAEHEPYGWLDDECGFCSP